MYTPKTILTLSSLLLFTLCFISKIGAQSPSLDKLIEQTMPKEGFTGLELYDLDLGQNVYSYNGQKNFVPASNLKLFSFYAASKYLPDSLSSFKYIETQDTLYLKPLGNPSFLHPKFKHQPEIRFLKNSSAKIIALDLSEDIEPYALGWSWDDYSYDYQAERSVFPIYGNLLKANKYNSKFKVAGLEFVDNYNRQVDAKCHGRDFHNNTFFNCSSRSNPRVPFITERETLRQLLQTETGKTVVAHKRFPKHKSAKRINAIDKESVLKRMLLYSDNFLAEQMLVMTAIELNLPINDDLKSLRTKLNTQIFGGNKYAPKWVDGSGLSRYNQISPKQFVRLLEKINKEVPEYEKYFPRSGYTGTLARHFGASRGKIHAKTGTLSGVFCLTGYLDTNSGKRLAFSFLNNGFKGGASSVKRKMQVVFSHVQKNYQQPSDLITKR